ncbi:MAG: HepT-like ribonuclease domain-containing protein [Cyanobacteriota bacterium]|nr:HepT-like ribonuclease domain-containing protein [Cyanobacteriota bacterium]
MNDRDRQTLLDIINSANLSARYLSGKTQTDFEDDRMLQDAIVRRLEIIGEAATRLSDVAAYSHSLRHNRFIIIS